MSDTGSPGYVLVDLVERSGAQLLVIGSRGLGRLGRAILGSVSDYVLHHVDIPVCICAEHAQLRDEDRDSQEDLFSDLIGSMEKQKLEEDISDTPQTDNFYRFLEES